MATSPALDNFVAFMTISGSAQQVLKDWMQADAQQAQGLGPLHLRALCLCRRNPITSNQVCQKKWRTPAITPFCVRPAPTVPPASSATAAAPSLSMRPMAL